MGSDNIAKERVVDTREAAMARLKLALEYLQSGQTEKAKRNLDRAFNIDSDLDGIHASYAYYFQQVEEFDKADSAYKKALRQFPDNANTRNNYGAFLCDLMRYEQANEQFLRAINTPENPAMANSYENAGLCALRDKRWRRAIGYLSKVLGYEPNRARSIVGLVTANININELESATKYLVDYRGRYVETPQSLWLVIQIEQKLGNQRLAQQLASILIRKYPDSKEVQLYRAKAL